MTHHLCYHQNWLLCVKECIIFDVFLINAGEAEFSRVDQFFLPLVKNFAKIKLDKAQTDELIGDTNLSMYRITVNIIILVIIDESTNYAGSRISSIFTSLRISEAQNVPGYSEQQNNGSHSHFNNIYVVPFESSIQLTLTNNFII